MTALPPTAKLPLAVRKNVRDEWENKKAEYEAGISEVLGVPWTIDINPLQIHAYATSDYGKESIGSCIAGYVEGVIKDFKDFIRRYGEEAKDEINTLAPAHVITMDLDTEKKIDSYCGAAITSSGQLAILFREGDLGSNIDQAFYNKNLTRALDNAPTSPLPMSYSARTSIKQDYEPKIGEIKAQIDKVLQDDIKIEPRFEEAYAKLLEKKGRGDWEETLGSYIAQYIAGLGKWLERKGFGSDDMLREGLLETVPSKTVVFRVTERSKMSRSYNESAVEDEVLYLQADRDDWGSNIDDVADNLMDLL